MERRTALSSENADDTSRKNNFEWRRLRNTLRDLEKDKARNQKKKTSEQVEYAMQNLSVDDLENFTSLTKKILRSSFLPPIMKPKVPGGTMAMSDPYAERLRGTKFMQNSTRRKQHKLSEKRLLRRSFSDTSLLQEVSHDERADGLGRRRKASLNYSSLFLRKQLHECHSDSSTVIHGRLAAKRPEKAVRFAGELSKMHSSSSTNNQKALSRNGKTGILSNKHHGDRRNREKHRQDGAEIPSRSEMIDNESEDAMCLSEVIERKLQLRELVRESRRARNIKQESADRAEDSDQAKPKSEKTTEANTV